MKFGIISYILHKEEKGRFYSYAPYIAEMDLWLKSVDKTLITAPKISSSPSAVEISYNKKELQFHEIPSLNFTSLQKSFVSIFKIPQILWNILKVMRQTDHIHLRCPGNISLLGCFLQIFFPHKPKTAKYAGNWDPEAKQPWSYKLQKWILSNTFLTRNMKVLVYGQWPEQSKNILPFFTASFSESEIKKIGKKLSEPYKFLFVGNLVQGKQPLFAIQLVEALNKRNIPAQLHIYGDGLLSNDLEKEADNKDYIHLYGNKPLEVLKQAYKDSHFLILASKSEGWPKAVAEAMFFGCIPVVTNVSCVSWMLAAPPAPASPAGRPKGGAKNVTLTKRGILIPDLGKGEKVKVDSRDVVEDTVERIIELINQPEEMRRMSMEAQEWSQEYTLERFENAIQDVLFQKKVRP